MGKEKTPRGDQPKAYICTYIIFLAFQVNVQRISLGVLSNQSKL